MLTLTINNAAPQAVALGGIAVSDAYPTGLVNAVAPGAATTCTAGTVTAAAGGASEMCIRDRRHVRAARGGRNRPRTAGRRGIWSWSDGDARRQCIG